MTKLLKPGKNIWLTLAMMTAYCCVLTCVSSFLFALILGNCYKTESLLLFVGGMLCCIAGYLTRLCAQKEKLVLTIGSICIGIAFGVILMYLLFIWSQASMIAVFCSFLYLIAGWLIQKTPFSKLSSSIMIIVCIGIHIAVYFFSYLIARLLKHLIFYQFPYQTYIFLIFPMILILLLFRNQSNLDELMTYGRKHIAKNATNNKMSVSFTVAVVLLVFLLYCLGGPVLSLLSFIGSYLKYGLDSFLQWFFELISSDRDPDWIPDPVADPPTPGKPELWMMIAMGFIVAIIVFIIAIMLIRCFPTVYQAICEWLHAFKKKFSKFGTVKKTENKYFYDNITDIDKDLHTSLTFSHLKRWGSFSRAYRHEKDPVQQIRLCYAYTLGLLRSTEDPPLDSDTPLEILHKMLQKKGIRQKVDLSNITRIYSDVRYAELSPTKENNAKMFAEVKAIYKRLKMK